MGKGLEKSAPALLEAGAAKEISVRTLVSIYLDDEVLRFVGNDTEDLVFEGNLYKAASIDRGEIKTSTDGETESVTLTMSNKWLEWAQYFAARGNKCNNRRCVIEEVFTDLLEEGAVWQFEGILNSPKMSASQFEIEVVRHLGDYSAESPNMTYDPNCQYRMFKDARCGYTGAETTCDKTMSRCKELGNVTRFGGHPSVPYEMVIRQK